MTMLLSSTHDVVESLNKIANGPIEVGIDDEVTLSVRETDVVARAITYETARDRNVLRDMDRELCSFKYDGTRLTLRFHENVVESAFELNPAGACAVFADQATDPVELAPALEPVLDQLEDAFDVVSYDFAEVGAASIASSGHLTDFEFEYVVTTSDL